MATVVLNAYSKAYPSITNRIRASVSLQSDPQALIATIVDNVAGHPERVWSFPGLPRNNYAFSLDEIDGADLAIRNLALFDVVPGETDGALNRDDEQIQVDSTPGFNAGLNVVVFDGTGGKPDYIGWEIVPSELTGRGILDIDLDYTWDKDTGTFTLLQVGDVLQAGNTYNIHFNPISSPVGNSYPTVTDFSVTLLTTTQALAPELFANKIIVEPASPYIELTLPSIAVIPAGRKLMVDVGGYAVTTVRIKPYGSDTINFLNGSIYAMPNESFSIYKFIRSAGVYEWRVCDADGNFKTVGQVVSDDQVQTGVFNKLLLDGATVSATQYARLYNEFVLNLPVGQVVNFDSWFSGTSKLFYSLANSANPANAGKFHIPDRRNYFERNNAFGKSGDFFNDTIASHTHSVPGAASGASGGGALTDGTNDGQSTSVTSGATGSTETAPKHYLINKYVLL